MNVNNIFKDGLIIHTASPLTMELLNKSSAVIFSQSKNIKQIIGHPKLPNLKNPDTTNSNQYKNSRHKNHTCN